MKSLKIALSITAIAAAVSITGCAPNISPNAYDVSNVGSVNNVVRGVIVSARPVQVNTNSNNNGVSAGGLAGALAGGAAGSAIGGGTRANLIGAVGGALLGGIAGTEIQKGLTRQTGIEYVIKTTGGNYISVVQGSQTALSVGQRVMVIYGAQSKVIPIQ